VNYCVGGADLESGATRIDGGLCPTLEEDGEFLELRDSWKILVQGSYGCIFPRATAKKKTRLTWTARRPQGHVAFFNYSCTAREALEVHFRDLSFTLLNTGPALPPSMLASKFASFEQSSMQQSTMSVKSAKSSARGPATMEPSPQDLQPVEEQAEQKAAVMARTASDPGLQVHYATPLDLTTANQDFVPSMDARDRHMRMEAAKRAKKAARRKDGGAAPVVKPARGDILSFVE
jgi:hypothetical protein